MLENLKIIWLERQCTLAHAAIIAVFVRYGVTVYISRQQVVMVLQFALFGLTGHARSATISGLEWINRNPLVVTGSLASHRDAIL
jgi:hypothetical protein